MSVTQAPPAKLVMGVLFRERPFWERAAGRLVSRYGPLEDERLEFPFADSQYYQAEMGAGLTRLFCAFQEPVSQDELAGVKRWTCTLEEELAESGPEGKLRRVNLDPGLLTLENLVLATRKNFSHRICLAGGVFAEVTLIFRDNRFRPLEWTYPDYCRRETLAFFERLRVNWRSRLRREASGGEKTGGATEEQ